MKIVIAKNECFNVPINIVQRYFELKDEIPYFYQGNTEYDLDNMTSKNTYILTSNPIFGWDTYIVTKNFGETAEHTEIFSESLFDEREISRTDLNFIKAVEELKPNNMKIVEIPDDVKWYIHVSDSGMETIHEEHRTWY